MAAARGWRVLGIDPGSRVLGFGAIERREGRVVHLGNGVVRVDPNRELALRLADLYDAVTGILARYRPDCVAVEGLFSFKGARSALTLAHARGVVLACAAGRGLEVHEYAPAEVKRAVGAPGGAGKGPVERMVGVLLGLDRFERPDAADALAVALCHLHRAAIAARVRAATGAAP